MTQTPNTLEANKSLRYKRALATRRQQIGL